MKKFIFLAALGAATLVSCDNRFDINRNETPETLGFSAYISRTAAKGSVTDVTAENLTSFKVAAYKNASSDKYFSSEQNATKQSSGNWATESVYYWPITGSLDFFAYSTSYSTSVSNTGGVGSIDYKATGSDDLVVAMALDQTSRDSDKTVVSGVKIQPLHFDHALTKINSLKVAAAPGASKSVDYQFVVTKVRFKDVNSTGTYVFNDGSWEMSSPASPLDYFFNFSADSFLGSDDYTSVDQQIIIPQTVNVEVVYSVKFSADGGSTYTFVAPSATKTVSIALEKGKAYDITLLLPNDASPIGFSADVTGWESSVPSTDPTPVE